MSLFQKLERQFSSKSRHSGFGAMLLYLCEKTSCKSFAFIFFCIFSLLIPIK
ncbi:hypothetical protein LEP1GSC121_1827 [Leptospira borgpetersenii serovar Castellonis str. 200801910]|nr:hypothetical protein LEP1GSC121_1827 [Leptospira borgpetersenii serovar Castellonis str. 200801910]